MKNINLSLSGQYKAEIKRGNGTIEEIPWFGNLITNLGLNRLGLETGVNVINNLKIGTGSSVPTVLQTSLDAKVAQAIYSASTGVNKGLPNYEGELTYTFTFAQGAVVGNMTEVGIGWDTGVDVFSRALFKDVNGDPITITLTAIDQLTVYYKLTVFPNLNDITGSFDISGVTYNYTIRPAYIASFFSQASPLLNASSFKNIVTCNGYGNTVPLAVITSIPSGTQYPMSSATTLTYVQNTFYSDITVTWGITAGNSPTGLKTFAWSHNSYNTFQMELDTPIMKTNTQVLTLNFRLSWSR